MHYTFFFSENNWNFYAHFLWTVTIIFLRHHDSLCNRMLSDTVWHDPPCHMLNQLTVTIDFHFNFRQPLSQGHVQIWILVLKLTETLANLRSLKWLAQNKKTFWLDKYLTLDLTQVQRVVLIRSTFMPLDSRVKHGQFHQIFYPDRICVCGMSQTEDNTRIPFDCQLYTSAIEYFYIPTHCIILSF